ncbi:MAG: hypothetical protein ACOVQA_07695 [Thermoflexibacteraceae bacterium]|jgi:hypothetical protein
MQQILISVTSSVLGATVTFLLQKQGLPAVAAASVVGLCSAVIGHFTQLSYLPVVAFAGAFVGMTSPNIASLPLIIVAAACAGLLYNVSTNTFVGMGGRLGVIAFLSVLLCYLVSNIWKS